MPSTRSTPARLWPLLLLLLPMALALLDLGGWGERMPVREAGAAGADSFEPRLPDHAPAPSRPGPTPRATQPTTRSDPHAVAAPPDCAPYARKACHEGDVWWLDGCGQPSERVEACEGRACLGVGCAPASTREDGCGGVSPYGTCNGDVATACVAGVLVDFDCAAKGQRCVNTREGARCLARTRNDCNESDRALCERDTLRSCIEGRWERIDCAKRLGRCAESGGSAQCVGVELPRSAEAVVERCDGEDDDHDGRIDEEQACEAVALVAFVAGGQVPAGLPAQLEHELAVVNRVYAPRVFRWAKTVPWSAPRTVHPDAFDDLAKALSLAESRVERDAARAQAEAETPAGATDAGLDFYIPVLFVDTIDTEPPTSGQASLPNSTCGGVRISDRPAPPEGLIVVGENRQPDTLAHELGHYLGLCHTHEELAAYGRATQDAVCEAAGDGVCDTPRDPGPERCALLRGCGARCGDPTALPDVSNVMSYYMSCRRGLSAEQLAVVDRGLALRRGWFRCIDPERCRCLPGERSDCPLGMSCRPSAGEGAGSCRLDGPALPGAPCRGLSECSDGALCMGTGAGAARASRCVRACRVSEPGCTCGDIGLSFPVCREDLP